MNKQWMIGMIVSVILSPSCAALGQTHRPIGPDTWSGPVPYTPVQKAKSLEAYRLAHAAAAALATGRYAEAETTARQALALGHDSGVAQEVLASALNAQGKEQEALHAYRMLAGGEQPRNLLPYALLLLKSGRWASAIDAYNKALPHLADGDLMRANSHFSASVPRPTALATAIHIALGLTDGSGTDWAGHTQRDKALGEFTKALQLAPTSPLTNFYYGYGLDQLGRTAQAAAVFQRVANRSTGAVKHEAKAALNGQRQRAYGLARHAPLPPRILSGQIPPSASQ